MLRITTEEGRSFKVICIRKGDHYGLDNCLVHDKEEPMIEFYGARDGEAEDSEPEGRFIASRRAVRNLRIYVTCV